MSLFSLITLKQQQLMFWPKDSGSRYQPFICFSSIYLYLLLVLIHGVAPQVITPLSSPLLLWANNSTQLLGSPVVGGFPNKSGDTFLIVSNVTQFLSNSTAMNLFIQGGIYDASTLNAANIFEISDDGILATNPSLDTFPSGYFVVVWQIVTQNGTNPGIYGQIFNEIAQAVGYPFIVPQFVTGRQSNPDVATFSNGNFIVVWQSEIGTAGVNVVNMQIFDSVGNRIMPQFQVNAVAFLNDTNPSVATFNNGNFVVVWNKLDAAGIYNVYAQVWDSSANRIGQEFQVNSNIGISHLAPDVATLSATSFIVVWQIIFPNRSNDRILGRQWNISDGVVVAIDNEFYISNGNEASQYPVMASLLEEGAYAVVWQTYNATSNLYGEWIYVYDPTNNASSSQDINFTSTYPTFPVVATLKDNVLVVAWLGIYGVYCQLFRTNITELSPPPPVVLIVTLATVVPTIISVAAVLIIFFERRRRRKKRERKRQTPKPNSSDSNSIPFDSSDSYSLNKKQVKTNGSSSSEKGNSQSASSTSSAINDTHSSHSSDSANAQSNHLRRHLLPLQTFSQNNNDRNIHINIVENSDKYATVIQPTQKTNFNESITQALKISQDRLRIPFKDLILKEEIGSGAYGKVYVGEWEKTEVAIKLNQRIANMENFLHEATLMVNLRPHPNVLLVLGISVDGPVPAIIMELCPGGSLDRHLFGSLKNTLPLNPLKLILGIARGMLHLHNNSIIHRDLAARNILIAAGGEPKISDFGLSRLLQSTPDEGMNTSGVVGPVKWMAPETLGHPPVFSPKSDVWSFGMVVYEIITRKEPHKDLNIPLSEIATQIRDHHLIPKIPDDCEPFYRELMLSCWSPDPSKRPSFEDIIHLVTKYQNEQIEKPKINHNCQIQESKNNNNTENHQVNHSNPSPRTKRKKDSHVILDKTVTPKNDELHREKQSTDLSLRTHHSDIDFNRLSLDNDKYKKFFKLSQNTSGFRQKKRKQTDINSTSPAKNEDGEHKHFKKRDYDNDGTSHRATQLIDQQSQNSTKHSRQDNKNSLNVNHDVSDVRWSPLQN
jgi:serine/threonine protein kinase